MRPDPGCPKKDQLRAYSAGQAPASLQQKIRFHLVDCDLCREFLGSLGQLQETTPFRLQKESAATAPVPGSNASKTSAFEPDFPQVTGGPGEAQNPNHTADVGLNSQDLRKKFVAPPTGSHKFLQPPQGPEEIGRLGNYRVFRLLGKGGMGVVYLAEDISLHRPVALKVMRPEFHADPECGKRFLREARTMASLKHENLVTIYQAGQENDVVYFAMELLHGESLEDWLKHTPLTDLPDLLRIGKQIAQGLDFIHQKNLIHRDIKPANIWLENRESGIVNRESEIGNLDLSKSLPSDPRSTIHDPRFLRVKILDLGLARSVQEETHQLTGTGVILGTPGFMSPEQARDEEVDASTDLFSLGCVLYNLATGRRPFEGKTTTSILMALASTTPIAVSEINPLIPQELSDLIMQLLSRRPKKRPTSAAEVVRRLDDIAHGNHDSVPATARVEPKIDSEATLKGGKSSKKAKVSSKRIRSRKEPAPEKTGWVIPTLVGGCVLVGVITGIVLWNLPRANQQAKKGTNPPPIHQEHPPEKPPPPPQNKKPPEPGNNEKPKPPVNPPTKKVVEVPKVAVVVHLKEMKEIASQNWPFDLGKEEKKEPKKGKKDDFKKDFPPPPNANDPIKIRGKLSPHGIFMHPPGQGQEGQPASITYSLERKFTRFQAEVSINDGPQFSEVPCTFAIYGDGKLLWESPPIRSQADAQTIDLPIPQVDLLRIQVTCPGPPLGAHAVWIDPRVSR